MEAEQQQGHKTIIAFMSGLVIGGLLMMVFGADTKNNKVDVKKTDEAAQTENKTEVAPEGTENTDSQTGEVAKETTPAMELGDGSIAVANAQAGTKVSLGDVKYPSEAGWIAVHLVDGENLGAVLGAARYNVKEGLAPKDVELYKTSTKSGVTYAVVFHEDNKDGKYTSAGDKVMMKDGKFVGTTFKAE